MGRAGVTGRSWSCVQAGHAEESVWQVSKGSMHSLSGQLCACNLYLGQRSSRSRHLADSSARCLYIVFCSYCTVTRMPESYIVYYILKLTYLSLLSTASQQHVIIVCVILHNVSRPDVSLKTPLNLVSHHENGLLYRGLTFLHVSDLV